ncbi:MAG: hypothetical protein R2879_18370 [Saprospiraceae bacterium]
MPGIDRNIKLIFKISAFSVFAGRAWQHIFWDAPLRTVLWEEKWMKPIVEGWFGMPWGDYVSSPVVDANIQHTIQGMGVFYALLAIAVLFYKGQSRIHEILFYIGSGLLFLLGICYLKVAFFSLGQLLEYTLQFTAPIFLIWSFKSTFNSNYFLNAVKVAIALTFTCHGLYAIGYYPVPGKFVQMVISILGVSDSTAFTFLKTAAILDLIVAVGIFIPGKAQIYPLMYAVFWGFATSIARVWANFYPEMWMESISHWLPETVFRFPHFLGPLAIVAWHYIQHPDWFFKRKGSIAMV